jgi:TP901 family phage tail tape measure protein
MAENRGLKAVIGFDDSALKSGIAGIPQSLQNILGPVGAIAGQLGLALSGPAILGGIAAIGTTFEDSMRTIRVGTGATGPLLEGLAENFRNVAGNADDSLADVATAIADLNTRMGITGPELESLSAQFLDLADITGTDLQQAIASGTRVFGDWGIATEDASGKLDYLFKVSQSTGISFGSLSAQLVQFGAPLRQLGFDFDEAAALLGKFEKEGVNSELVMGSLRIALGKFAREGIEDVRGGLELVTQKIKEAGTAGEANAIALEVFGARAGADMAAAIREGRFEIDELVAALRKSKEGVSEAANQTKTFNERLDELKNKAFLAAEPLGGSLVISLNNVLTVVNDLSAGLIGLHKEFGIGSGEGVISQTWKFGAQLNALLNPGLLAVQAIDRLTAGYADLKEKQEAQTKADNEKIPSTQKMTAETNAAAAAATTQTDAERKLTEEKRKLEAQIKNLLTPKKELVKESQSLNEKLEERYKRYLENKTEEAAWSAMLRRLEGDQKALNNVLDDYAKVKAKAAQEETKKLTKDLGDQAQEFIDMGLDIQDLTDIKVPDFIDESMRLSTEVQPAAIALSAEFTKLRDSFLGGAYDMMHSGIDDLLHGDFSFSALTNAAKQAGLDIVHTFAEPFIAAVTGPDGVIAKALTPLINKMLEVTGLTGSLLGSAGSSVAGGVASGAAGAAGSVAGAAGSAGSTAGSAAGAAASGVMGVIGAVGSIGAMVSGIIGNFQMAGMNKTLDLIEHEVRYTKIATVDGEYSVLRNTGLAREYLFYLVEDSRTGADSVKARLSNIDGTMGWMLKKIESGGGVLDWLQKIQDNTFWGLKKLEDISAKVGNISMTATVVVNGAQDPAATANAVAEALNRQARLRGGAVFA